MPGDATVAEAWFPLQGLKPVQMPNNPAPRPLGDTKKEWASALLLVEEACESIKSSEERVEALERELHVAETRAREIQTEATKRLEAAQSEIELLRAMNAKLETRATEAEEWLKRLNDAIVSKFGGASRGSSAQDRTSPVLAASSSSR